MARIALTKEEVMAAFEKLIQDGATPSAENIHGLLGKGSIGAINRYIKEIIDENNQALLSGRDKGTDKEEFSESNFKKNETTLDLPFDAPARDVGNQAPSEAPRVNMPEIRKVSLDERRTEPEIIEPPLESLSEDKLIIKVRRLESMLLKEQARREASERVALDTQTYADNIREQVSERISEMRQSMELVIEQLKQQLKEQKQNYELDLKFYREQMEKANKKLAELLG
jgi:Plasmid replication region DNA-binding N-term